MRNSGWQIWAVHLPGHSRTGGDFVCPSADALAAMLVDLVHGEGGAALAGYSMGGRLALHAALAHPDVFPAVIGISTTAGISDPLERRARRAADAALAARLRRARETSFAKILCEWWELPVFDSPLRDTAARDDFLASRLEHKPALLAKCLEAWGSGCLPSQWERLAGYPGRALLVSGEADLRFTDVARRMGLLFKHAQIEHVPGSGHRLLLEKPRALAHLVTRFFANTAASGH